MLNDNETEAMAIKYYQRYLDLHDRTLIGKYGNQSQEEIEAISCWLPESYKKFLRIFGISEPSGLVFWAKSNHPSIDLDTCNSEIRQNVLFKTDDDVTYFADEGESVQGFRHTNDGTEPKLVVTDHYGTYERNETFWAYLLGVEVDLYQNSKDLSQYGFNGFLDMDSKEDVEMFDPDLLQ
ncbi:hypothetical protein ACRYI5_06645 [Furfurilactobacillus sp. WILCCON 0119]